MSGLGLALGISFWSRNELGGDGHHEGSGNVDHISWGTMTDDGPQIGNIALKGVFDRNGLDPSVFGAYDRKGAEN